ncbi:hypothetical protein PCHCB_000508100, partial [Plasmodium chabaudi chabaudi]
LSDNLPDTESGPTKRIKRSISQENSLDQEKTTETQTPNSSSEQSQDIQKSSDSNNELNIKKVIDYSVDFFRTYSSLFNDVVNKIEDHIQEIVVSKINDIIEKIHKYQQIIQKVGSTIGQIQILNDHQNGSEKSPDTQNEVGSTQGNANHGINNLKNSTNETNSQQKNLETKQGSQNSVSENQGIGSNISGDTESGPTKRIKRSISQENSLDQEKTTETQTPNSSSEQSQDIQKSSDSNNELNIKKVIDYSVDFFRTYSSLFNDVVNKIEEHIQEIVVSKINDIIEKIHKYQQIIQKVGSTIGQIQILNDHQNGSEKSPDTQNEVGSTQGNANHGINNLKNSTNETNSQQKNLETKQGSQNSVSENQGIGSNISGGGINTDKQPQKVLPSPSPQASSSSLHLSPPPVTSSPSATSSITLSSSVHGTIPIEPITTVSAGEKVETTMSSIESTLYEQNGGSNKKSRRKRSADSGSSISIIPTISESTQETQSS